MELENIEKVELKYTLDEQKILLLEQENEIKRLEKLLEYHEEVIEKENGKMQRSLLILYSLKGMQLI